MGNIARRDLFKRGMLITGGAALGAVLRDAPPVLAAPPVPALPVRESCVGDAHLQSLVLGDTWTNFIREMVLAGLSKIPVAGEIIEALVGFFWHSQTDIWGEIKAQVEALIAQKIADYEYGRVTDALTGLGKVLSDYSQAVTHNYTADEIRGYFISARTQFDAAQPSFMAQGYELLLLPLLAQLANMQLALLRDGVVHGKDWNFSDADIADLHTSLKTQIDTYGSWVDKWYAWGNTNVLHPAPRTYSIRETTTWAANNAYVRGMTLGVLDHKFYWSSFDPTNNPDGKNVPKNTREIYSEPEGTSHTPHAVAPPNAKITALNVWGWDRLDGVQAAYGGQWSPRQGDQGGGSNQPPHGWSGPVPDDDPLTSVSGRSGDIPNSMQLTFKSGKQTNVIGGGQGSGAVQYSHSFDGHQLSSIQIMGVAGDPYNSADCVIFGFRLTDSY
jgi:hypothetical protein